ncbi:MULTISPECIES: VOC family protein [Paenibacillus]|uniref:VOC family protein n=1 Tax=Paenibacillus TaxID=44249 RepID=UPI0011A2EE70|nr:MULTISPECIES: VOC family protein [Paenibacillus]MCM3493634.1 VOC family protein [Paenibacillus lactis]
MQAQLIPFIISGDARAQAAFYIEAVGGEIHVLSTFGDAPGTPESSKDKVMHLSMTLAGGNTLIMSDAFQDAELSANMGLSLSFDDEEAARTAYRNLSAGGVEKYPFALQPWGNFYYGELVDRFGMTWQLVKQG